MSYGAPVVVAESLSSLLSSARRCRSSPSVRATLSVGQSVLGAISLSKHHGKGSEVVNGRDSGNGKLQLTASVSASDA